MVSVSRTNLRQREATAYSAQVQQQNMRDWLLIFQKIVDNPRANEVEVEQAKEDIGRCLRKLSASIEVWGEVYPDFAKGVEER